MTLEGALRTVADMAGLKAVNMQSSLYITSPANARGALVSVFTSTPSRLNTTLPVPAAGLARRFTDGQWQAVETGIGDIHATMLATLPAARAAALCETVTIDLDTTDVEVYGRKKRGRA